MNKIKIINKSYSFAYQPIANVPQKYLSASKILIDVGYTIPTVLPMGENVPNDVPIVILKRECDNSQISICRNKCLVAIDTNSDNRNDDKIISAVYEFMESIIESKDSLLYFGLTMNQQFVSDNAVELIKNKFGIHQADICDIDVTFTEIVSGKFYSNTRISNSRVYDSPINPNERGFLNIPSKHAVNLIIDVNNRYVFNIGNPNLEFDGQLFFYELKEIERIAEEKYKELSVLFKGSD